MLELPGILQESEILTASIGLACFSTHCTQFVYLRAANKGGRFQKLPTDPGLDEMGQKNLAGSV